MNSKMKLSSILYLSAGLLLGLGLVFGLQAFRGPYRYQGTQINPPYQADNFTLTDQTGQAYQLSSQRGKVTLLFFGYSQCTDVCPATLADFKQIRDRLGNQAQDTAFIFITVDPEHDTPAVLKAYLAKFDPNFTGLTGSRDQLLPVWKSYGVYQNNQTTAASLDALIDHSSYIYVIDRSGKMRETFSYGDPVDGMVMDVQHLIKE
jgi:protein SCO1